jgi:hypothetical protein
LRILPFLIKTSRQAPKHTHSTFQWDAEALPLKVKRAELEAARSIISNAEVKNELTF